MSPQLLKWKDFAIEQGGVVEEDGEVEESIQYRPQPKPQFQLIHRCLFKYLFHRFKSL